MSKKLPDTISSIPEGALARIEITVMPGGLLGVHIFPNDPVMAVGVMAAAMDMYGYEVTVSPREGGKPSDCITDFREIKAVSAASWSPGAIAIG